MKVHHLSCGCMCPIGGRYLPEIFPKKLVCHCLLVESSDGLVLIDTGFGQDFYNSSSRIRLEKHIIGLQSDISECAVNQIKKLGFKIEDVQHIIPTHLDNDHAGGIYDFPYAAIHTSELELDAALNPSVVKESMRYRDFQLKDFKRWKIHDFAKGESWFGFQSVQAVPALKDEVLLIPLLGHTRGHFGVAVRSKDHWYLHVGDSYYEKKELQFDPFMTINPFLRSVHCDFEAAMENLIRIQKLKEIHGGEITIFSAHDPDEYDLLKTS